MTNKISCIVVDDDEVDLHATVSFLEDYPFLEIAGCYESSAAALAAARQNATDVLFLDIDMPGMSGLKLREQLLNIPACVFITSYPDYALEGYEMAAFDFLIKPLSGDRFAKTIDRLKTYMEIRQKAEILSHTLGADTIFIKDGTSQVKLQLHEIIYFEALNNYTRIVTTAGKYMVLCSLGNLLKEPVFSSFMRIHRSYAIQKHFINKISSGEVLVDNTTLPVGRIYKDSLRLLKP